MRFDVALSMSGRLDVAFACTTDALAIVGPSGAGKSSLLDGLAGVAPGRGHVRLDGHDVRGVPLERRRVGYLTQDALLFPHLSVAENLAFSPRAVQAHDVLDSGDVVEALHLGPLLERRPRHLSGGERRRVALARALLSAPEILLLDEPFAGLDAQRRRDALSIVQSVRRRFGMPMVLVSHVPEEIVGVAEYALRLEQGRLVAEGPAPSVLRSGETRVDNHLQGEVLDDHRVRVGGRELVAALPAGLAGDVRLACFAHDILLARERPQAISARNVFPARVASLVDAGDAVLVELDAPRLVATLTPAAVAELDLAPGREIFALLKATSLCYLGPA